MFIERSTYLAQEHRFRKRRNHYVQFALAMMAVAHLGITIWLFGVWRSVPPVSECATIGSSAHFAGVLFFISAGMFLAEISLDALLLRIFDEDEQL